MEIVLLLLDAKKVTKRLIREKKRIIRRRRHAINAINMFINGKEKLQESVLEALSLSKSCYLMKLERCVNRLVNNILNEMKNSDNIYPQLVVRKSTLDIIQHFNDVQSSQQEFVESLISQTPFSKIKSHQPPSPTCSPHSSSSPHSSPKKHENNDHNHCVPRVIVCDDVNFHHNVCPIL